VWSSSLYETVHHVLAPIASTGALAGAPVWALAAASLPYLVKRRSLPLDTIRVVGWAAFVVSATELATRAAATTSAVASPHTAVLGAAAGALVALCPSAAAAWRQRRGLDEPQPGLS
jgi:hypothetical protein